MVALRLRPSKQLHLVKKEKRLAAQDICGLIKRFTQGFVKEEIASRSHAPRYKNVLKRKTDLYKRRFDRCLQCGDKFGMAKASLLFQGLSVCEIVIFTVCGEKRTRCAKPR